MRIFSKFRDYYDNIVPFDEDGALWERKSHTIDADFQFYHKRLEANISADSKKLLYSAYHDLPRVITSNRRTISTVLYDSDNDYTMIIGFCGKLYPVIVSDNKCFFGCQFISISSGSRKTCYSD